MTAVPPLWGGMACPAAVVGADDDGTLSVGRRSAPIDKQRGAKDEIGAEMRLSLAQRAILGWANALNPTGLTDEQIAGKAERLLGMSAESAYNAVRSLEVLKLIALSGERRI